MYVEDQPPFLNACGLLNTDLGPFGLLARIKALELEIGRLPRVRNGPREIDIDLIAYGVLQLRSKLVYVPHPRLIERRFVLQPLFDIAPDLHLGGLGVVRNLLCATQEQADHVRKLAEELVG
jgi:2-amino-4-hydroxy-6-hydroxymethyldihydropteridine diphosphokinase